MKTNILKLGLILFLIIAGAGCRKGVPPADLPGVAIYKTRNDYFDKVGTALKDGKVLFKPSLHGKVEFDDEGNILYKKRVKLTQGYVLASEDGLNTAFLSYTIREYYDMESQKILPTDEEIKSNIIDEDPFWEFYEETTYGLKKFSMEDTALINEIIRNGEIEKHFKKLK